MNELMSSSLVSRVSEPHWVFFRSLGSFLAPGYSFCLGPQCQECDWHEGSRESEIQKILEDFQVSAPT